MKVSILGAGVMGTALTIPLSKKGQEISLWGTEYDEQIIEIINKTGKHPRLPIKIPKSVKVFKASQLVEAVTGSNITIFSVTSEATGLIAEKVAPYLPEDTILMTVAKGFEVSDEGKLKTLPEIIRAAISRETKKNNPIITIRGPSIAKEVAIETPTSVVFASKRLKAAKTCKQAFENPSYKVSLTDDLIGVELCAAMKNIYAIGIGVCDGIAKKKRKPMNNTKAALLTLALSETVKLVEILGGFKTTVYGLAGLGDLDVTARGGRNRMFGELLGRGLTAEEALLEMKNRGLTVEGYVAAEKALKLTQKLDLEGKISMIKDLPLLNEINSFLFKGDTAETAIYRLFKNIDFLLPSRS